jgi:hypothetical protein
LTIPAGTHIRVTTAQDLGSKISQPGQTFSATVADPVAVRGVTVIRRGASATGTVVDAKALGHFKGGAVLELRLGALIGGLAGGGKGALIGGLAGAGAGTAGSAFTGNKEIVIPAETPLTFRLERAVPLSR